MGKNVLQELFDNAVHIGHRTQKWNPKMRKFIYEERDGVHIINLEKTLEYLEKAKEFISKLVTEGKIILFVSTKPQSLKVVESAARGCHMPYVISKWIPGLLTNFPTIKRRIKYFTDLKTQEAAGEFEKYTKKEAGRLRKDIEKLQASFGGVENLTDKPDAIFVVDAVRDKIAVKEANKLGISVVAITDTNADPSAVTCPIPANDDALKSITYVITEIAEVVLKANKSKK